VFIKPIWTSTRMYFYICSFIIKR